MDMRGLKNFIKEIREVADNRDAEVRRVEVELGKIRAKFKQSSSLTAYDRKKYVCKLLFIFMLGYQVEFGHMEAVQLLGGESASEKVIGYLAMALFLHDGHELLTLTTHTVCVDLAKGDELRKCLALTALANVASRDFADAMGQHVQAIAANKSMPTMVRKKAMLAALRIHRRYRGCVDPSVLGPAAADAIVTNDVSLSMAACTLALGLLQDAENVEYLKGAQAAAIKMLERIILDRASPAEFIHCGVPSPWLQGKLVRLLQEFPVPESVAEQEAVSGVLARIVRATSRTIQEAQTSGATRHDPLLIRCNCMVSVLAEIVSLVIQWNVSSRLLGDCRDALGLLLNDRKDPNRRYVGLTLLTRMSFCQSFVDAADTAEPDATTGVVTFATAIAKYQPIIVAVLHDVDDSLRKRALDLLYAMSDAGNAAQVVGELLEYLPHADQKFREYLVLMIAILAEKFCGDITWYVDVLVAVIEQGGDVVTDDIWQRLVHITVNAPNVQTHAVDTVFRALQRSTVVNEPLTRVGALLLGEFGYQIALISGSSPMEQLTLLHSKYALASRAVQAMLLSTFVKFYNLYDNPAVREKIKKVIAGVKSSFDPELQQRATEYYQLITSAPDEVLQAALEPLPPFELQASTMTERLHLKQRGEAKDLWSEKGRRRDEAHLRQSAILRQAAAKGTEGTERDAAHAAAKAESAHVEKKLQAPSHTDPNAAAIAAVRDGQALAQKLAAARAASASAEKPAAQDSEAAAAPAPHRESSDFLGSSSSAKKPADDLDSIFGGPTAPPPATKGSAANNDSDLERRSFAVRLNQQDAVAFSDRYVEVKFRWETRGADARATMTVVNKHSEPLQDLAVRIQSMPSSLIVQMMPLKHTGPLAPNASAEALFAGRCLSTFEHPAKANIAGVYGTDGRVSVSVPLPFYSTTFIEPYKLDNIEKFEALWDNTRGGAAGNTPTVTRNVRLSAALLQARGGDAVAAVERALFQQLRFFTLKASSSKIYAIGAYSYMPEGQTQYSPILVRAEAASSAPAGSPATDDPFDFAPKPAGTSSLQPGTASIETKCPDGALQQQLHALLEGLLQGRGDV